MYIIKTWIYNKREWRCGILAMTEERKEYLYQYQKEKLKRVPLDLKKSDYEKVASAANEKGMSVNGYIKEAINEKIEREALKHE